MFQKKVYASRVARLLLLLLPLSLGCFADAVPVTTKKLEEVVFYPTRDAPATAVSLNDTRVSAELSGVLSSIEVRLGDGVEKGQVLAKIVCKDYLLSVEQAKAALKAALAQSAFDRSQLEKARKLSKQKSISGDELDRRIANASRSEADSELQKAILKSSAHSVDKCSLRAPFDAVVVEKIANVGDYLVPGSPVVRLLDNEEIEISARVQ
jgi:RND family efflux transporter MFP subunit